MRYPLRNWRQSRCFVRCWLLLALLSSHLHVLCVGSLFFCHCLLVFKSLQFQVRLWCFLCCKAPLIRKFNPSNWSLPEHVAAVASWRCTGIDTQILHTDRGCLWRAIDRATWHLQPFLLPSINLVNLWLFFFLIKKKRTKTGIYIICKCVILQVARSQGNLKAPCVTRGRWVPWSI